MLATLVHWHASPAQSHSLSMFMGMTSLAAYLQLQVVLVYSLILLFSYSLILLFSYSLILLFSYSFTLLLFYSFTRFLAS
ncbi:hypothetical protein EW081_06515 [Vibrio vulnificus]|nr:hypothetical protein [Vibrio vulnificus]EGR0846701.1 hypothetical protein [Vibrio vulnificus]EGR0851117.1 hypothetical protein [Vibrio vulnificus]EGR0855922.1 hypothetical protein [Vibrio vulnificus]EGR0863509.1 hypothetical protein [Vibrio vulnificus]